MTRDKIHKYISEVICSDKHKPQLSIPVRNFLQYYCAAYYESADASTDRLTTGNYIGVVRKAFDIAEGFTTFLKMPKEAEKIKSAYKQVYIFLNEI